jgi:16S rRNA (uracil1498-N3)-methyltransferase
MTQQNQSNKNLDLDHFCLLNGLEVISDRDQIHQIAKVLRLKPEDTIIGIWQEKEFLLKIIEICTQSIKLETIEELESSHKELNYYLRVLIPLLKGEKTEWVLQKCTELGVYEFQFVDLERSLKQSINWEHKLQRWQKIVTEAVEQSERVKIPIIKKPINLQDFTIQDNELGIAFIERISDNPTPSLNTQNYKQISLLFGPEGGFTEQEKLLIKQKGFQTISLGARILRAETAIVVGSGLLSCPKEII